MRFYDFVVCFVVSLSFPSLMVDALITDDTRAHVSSVGVNSARAYV